MTAAPPLHLFAGVGIELEYMIVDRDSLDVKPITDEVLRAVTGSYYPEYVKPGICWSNELALHVIELKTCEPVDSLTATAPLFQQDVVRINEILAGLGARLLPTGAHPWMDPFTEMRLWPHRYNAIYTAYNEIFDCRGHGWANLQSAHLNLPFADDEEFGRLHGAIRLLLPIMPALAASSPMVDDAVQPSLDHRLEVYRTNSARIPSITGEVVPEPVFTRADYEEQIFARMYTDIGPYDPEGILQEEWLNARGAIARFDRSAIEIRVLDVQECPLADCAIAALLTGALKALVQEAWCSTESQQRWQVAPLAAIFRDCVRAAEHAVIADRDYLALFDYTASPSVTAGGLWQHILERLPAGCAVAPAMAAPLAVILRHGSLASRIRKGLAGDFSRQAVKNVYQELAGCLAGGQLFIP